MAPAGATPTSEARIGPHPSYIEVAKPYLLQATIDKQLTYLSLSESKELSLRLQGVSWIDSVRRSLQLPVRTFNTAVVYYHKFRLLHPEQDYSWADAAAAALFTACKIEDTLKKSREILCANWNLKITSSTGQGGELASPDDPRFENHAKLIIGLERLMLESAGFDFRNRYPQKLVVKMGRAIGFQWDIEGKTAWNLSLDLYRTWAPIKQTTSTLAIACVELAGRLHDWTGQKVNGLEEQGFVDVGVLDYNRWCTSRGEVMETILDLLDLYMYHRNQTILGPLYALDKFTHIKIDLNKEATDNSIPRYTQYDNNFSTQPANGTATIKARNGIDPTSPLTPATPLGAISPGQGAPTSAIGIRGQSGTVRFMLDAARARDEKRAVDRYWIKEQEEYTEEVPIIEPERRREGKKMLQTCYGHDYNDVENERQSRGSSRVKHSADLNRWFYDDSATRRASLAKREEDDFGNTTGRRGSSYRRFGRGKEETAASRKVSPETTRLQHGRRRSDTFQCNLLPDRRESQQDVRSIAILSSDHPYHNQNFLTPSNESTREDLESQQGNRVSRRATYKERTCALHPQEPQDQVEVQSRVGRPRCTYEPCQKWGHWVENCFIKRRHEEEDQLYVDGKFHPKICGVNKISNNGSHKSRTRTEGPLHGDGSLSIKGRGQIDGRPDRISFKALKTSIGDCSNNGSSILGDSRKDCGHKPVLEHRRGSDDPDHEDNTRGRNGRGRGRGRGNQEKVQYLGRYRIERV